VKFPPIRGYPTTEWLFIEKWPTGWVPLPVVCDICKKEKVPNGNQKTDQGRKEPRARKVEEATKAPKVAASRKEIALEFSGGVLRCVSCKAVAGSPKSKTDLSEISSSFKQTHVCGAI